MLKSPNSLVHRFLKAKYFPRISFLEASIPPNASFIWRNICGSKETLKEGLRWHVGSGESIHIWGDKWLPSPSTYRVISPPRLLPETTTVDQLIQSESMTWNKELISQIFCTRDVEMILSIPLSHRCPRDSLIWHGTRNGSFSVKSAYQVFLSRTNHQEPSSSSGSRDMSQLWSSVWSAQVPPKVRLFIWKACKGILPTRARLFARKIVSSIVCPWCLEEAETSDHVLWGCEFVQKVWMAAPFSGLARFSERVTFLDLVCGVVDDFPSPALEVFFTTAWAIWNARNATLWENKIPVFDEICQGATALAIAFLDSGANDSESAHPCEQ